MFMNSKRQRTPFRISVLCLSGQIERPPLFFPVQLRALGPRGHKPEIQKGRERLSGFLSYACRARSSALRFSFLSSYERLGLEVKVLKPKKAKDAFLSFMPYACRPRSSALRFSMYKGESFWRLPFGGDGLFDVYCSEEVGSSWMRLEVFDFVAAR